MRPLTRFSRWIVFLFLSALAWPAVPGQCDEAPEATFLEQLAQQGIPAVYGVILDELTENAGTALVEGVKNRSEDLATLANQKVWRDKISEANQAIGRLSALLDIGGKVYSEQALARIDAGNDPSAGSGIPAPTNLRVVGGLSGGTPTPFIELEFDSPIDMFSDQTALYSVVTEQSLSPSGPWQEADRKEAFDNYVQFNI